MSISTIGSVSSQDKVANSYNTAQSSKKPQEDNKAEVTTIKTHCNKKHQHNQSCPHTTTTQAASKAGEPGNLLDARA